MKSNKILEAVRIFCVILAFGSIVIGSLYLIKLKGRENDYKALREEPKTVIKINEDDKSYTVETVDEETETQSGWVRPDFAGLKEMNPDIYAWIYIADSVVDYPILQRASDDTYYLKRNLDGTPGYPGCIYTESVSGRQFAGNTSTVIYGHNMKNGTMFGELTKYTDPEDLNSPSDILIATKSGDYHYDVIAAAKTDDDYLYSKYDMYSNEGIRQMLDDLSRSNRGYMDTDKISTLTEYEEYVILSTCVNLKGEARFLVVARRV